MESTKQRGLAYLPAVVYTAVLLPLLSVNEVLRLRRVCKQLKSVCDDHLKKKCHSKSIVRLRDSMWREENRMYKDSPLKEFLGFDSTSSIRIPSQHFYLKYDYEMSVGQISLNLSTRYGTQIKHLSMNWFKMELPFVSNSSEFHFFQNLTNLSSLTLDRIEIIVQNDVNDAGRKIEPQSLPTSFKNSISKFEVSCLCAEQVSDADKFWELVGLCEKLEYFKIPDYAIRDSEPPFQCRVLENCCKLIERKSSNINCFELRNLEREYVTLERSEESLKSFSELSLRNKIKWENVPAWILEDPLYKTTWTPNADLIVSMSNFYSQNAEGLSFPNLVSLEVGEISVGLPMSRVRVRDWSKIPQVLAPSIYPALRSLEVTSCVDEDNIYFSRAWQYLTNLEEVAFKFVGWSMSLSSDAFLGNEDEPPEEPPFLRLIRLKKLSFHNIRRPEARSNFTPSQYCIIGEAFRKAFRLMPLKEFNITSATPICTRTFNRDAILALCSPGPFIENIEKFSFRNWSMEGVTDDEFRQLGQMFPNNQAL